MKNGSGKSTLVEAIAVAAGFNPEGGTTNFKFTTRSSESGLHRCLRLARGVVIFAMTSEGLTAVAYEDTEHYALTRDFLLNRERYMKATVR